MPKSQINRKRMSAWVASVDRIVAAPPGIDDGCSQAALDSYSTVDFSKFSTWQIVCEEVLDTTYPRIYFERARAELRRRGIADDEYYLMRRFAWLTAGWLNFEKMLWEWCILDERDVYHAIDWQYAEGWVSKDERDQLTQFADRYAKVAAQAGAPEQR